MSTARGGTRGDEVTISWEDLERRAGGKVQLTPTQLLGFRLFKVIMWALGAGLAAAVIYAMLTWPTPGDVKSALESVPAEDRATALVTLRTAWHQDVRETIQALLVSPFVPLLSAIVGYVLARQDGSSS